jgi:hypothetical protein
VTQSADTGPTSVVNNAQVLLIGGTALGSKGHCTLKGHASTRNDTARRAVVCAPYECTARESFIAVG